MNKLAMFFTIAMSCIKSIGVAQPSPNSNRFKKINRRGYYVKGERVYYRPAAPWVPNIKGTRFYHGKRVARSA